jgi:AhpD family alkylhydroperoxidase
MSEYRSLKEFLSLRDEQNGTLVRGADRILKRVLSVDSSAYAPGALEEGMKELLGLTASLVLRCDDCIAWHVHRCIETGVSREQFTEALGIGAVVGGTITIPHIRRAMVLWESEHLEDNGEN